MPVSFELADQFFRVPSDGGAQYLGGLYDSLGVDQKAAADIYPFFFVINTIEPANGTRLIGSHGERDVFPDHLAKLRFIPDLVGENAVGTDRKDICSQGNNVIIAHGYVRNLGGSDKGKIPGIKTKNEPFTFVILQRNLLDLAVVVRFGREGRSLFCYQHGITPFQVLLNLLRVYITTNIL